MNDPGIHAEASVIKKLQYIDTKRKLKWEKIHMIVVRLKRNDGDVTFSMSTILCILGRFYGFIFRQRG